MEIKKTILKRRRWLLWVPASIIIFLLLIILAPSSGKARPIAIAIKCANNLKQIGLAIQKYAYAHNCDLPDSLDALLETKQLTPNILVCPTVDERERRETGCVQSERRAIERREALCVAEGAVLRLDNHVAACIDGQPTVGGVAQVDLHVDVFCRTESCRQYEWRR